MEEKSTPGLDSGRSKGVTPSPMRLRRVFKVFLISLSLLVVCTAILTATKSYGVWVISGIAVVLFVLGLLKKETPKEDDGSGQGKESDR